ncbi:MAG: ABC transporter permease [Caldilineaceae bacterium]
MNIGIYLWLAIENMFRNKLRTFLTLLGLIVGIASVVVMTGIGNGFSAQAEKWFAQMLPNKFTVQPGYTGNAAPPMLTMLDTRLLQQRVGKAGLKAVAASIDFSDLKVKGFDPNIQPVQISATSADYVQMGRYEFLQGRFFTSEEEANESFVAVINDAMQSALLASSQANMSVIFIENKPFTVVGVIKEGQDGFSPYGGMPHLFIPISLLKKQLYSQSVQRQNGEMVVYNLQVLSEDVAHLDETKREAERVLRLLHGLRADQSNDFEFYGDQTALETMQSFNSGFTLVLGGIGAIALVVGGIGIMNIMLASISERTREIGLRKAIGAKNRDILAQFLLEAIAVCFMGGLFGVALSYGISVFLDKVVNASQSMAGIQVLIDMRSIILATVSSVACGIIFGLYPAIRATQYNPIEALRNE